MRVPVSPNAASVRIERLLEVADVFLHVAAVPVEVEDRIADELSRPVERGLAAAVGLGDLDVHAVRAVELRRSSVRRPVVTTGGCSRRTPSPGSAPCETAPASDALQLERLS